MKLLKKILLLFLILFCSFILMLSIRGNSGNPTAEELNNIKWKDEGPLELSPERGRFALLYSIIEDKSFIFSIPVARFALPDLGYKNGDYVSLFAPGVSILVAPGYILGKMIGLSQVGTIAVISLFAILNVILIRAIAIRLNANETAATIGGILFLFASPAFPYAVSLYQHHISTFLILLSIMTLLKTKSLWSLLLIWFLVTASIPIDYPNFFLLAPIALFALGRLIYLEKSETHVKLNIRFIGFLTFITAIIPVAFFLWFNNASYGDPLQLSGTVASVKSIDEKGAANLSEVKDQNLNLVNQQPIIRKEKTAIGFFETRRLLNGFYVHFISIDRGIMIFTPVVLFSLAGIWILYKKNSPYLALILGIILVDILLYSLWGDPWGGWAFGSRYLIPSFALLSIFTAIGLSVYKKNLLYLLIFLLLASYSIGVNTLGALTSNRNPPLVEIPGLEKLSGIKQKVSIDRNLEYLEKSGSKSFVYKKYLSGVLTPWNYFLTLSSTIISILALLLIKLSLTKDPNQENKKEGYRKLISTK